MTISSTTRKAGPFIGNGTATVFPFTFKVFQRSDIQAVTTITATGAQATLTLDSGYSVTLNVNQNASPGGFISLLAGALTTGKTLVITSGLPNTQPTDITNLGGFYPSVINDAFDRVTILIQQLQYSISFALQPQLCVATTPGTVYQASGNVAAVFVNGVLEPTSAYIAAGGVITFNYTLDPGDIVNALCTTY
jgi:hypothetical protein